MVGFCRLLTSTTHNHGNTFAKKDYDHATATASRALQLGLVLGLVLPVILAVGLHLELDYLRKTSVSSTSSVLASRLLQLLNQSIPWPLFFMMSILEHPILHVLPAIWFWWL